MKYVLDCSVALKTVLPEVDSWKAIGLLKEYSQAIHELLAPDIFPPEIANGLATAERQARIQSGEAGIFLADLMQNAPVIHSSTPLLARAVEISVANKVAVYDCIYLALAELEGCEMVSADEAFVKKMRAKFPFLVRLADVP
jgi:predicted nucleic acid-binding protein